jgi:radical SAM domain protein
LKTLDEISGHNCRYMTFIGGEYFLYPKWKDLLAEAAKRKITTNIISNGWMVNEDVVDFMKTANFDGLGISIDGGTAQTHDYIRQVPGMFDRAFRAVDAANRKRLAIGAIFLKRCLNPLQTDIWTNKDNSFYRTESC